jgi:signal transduction histidine kinase
MPASSGPAPSLRRSLLRRLAAPFSLLALASGLIAFGLALQYTERVVDRSLSDLATSIAQEVHVSGDRADETVPSLAEAMFSDPVEQLVYRVSDGQVELAGNADLPLEGTEVRRMNRATLFDATFEGNSVRVAQVLAPRVNGRPLIIEVGQRFGRRYRLAAEFLTAIMMPLVILLLVGSIIVWRVVNQQLGPLGVLADSLNQQTHTSLEQVDETFVPNEIRPLTSAVNGLLERLNLALDAQRKFIADAAHQLRTPLTAIKLHAEQAFHARDEVSQRSAISELRASADRAVRLSNQLLSLARAEPGEQQTARFVSIDLADLAFETGAEWVPRAITRHIDLGFADDDNDQQPATVERLIVSGNPVLLSEVLANLIDNALKYVPPYRVDDGRITITVSRHVASNTGAPLAELVVEDNGPGVPLSMRAELFKRFFRGDGHGESDGGAGLGLAIVRDIVVLHGGTIHYEDGSGGGARFVIRLPLAPAIKTRI